MNQPVLAGLEPAEVFAWFETICAIPHGSTNTRQISDFCVNFARERGLRCRQDAANNVIIWKDASVGYEDHPTVILQGHIDMVCEKEPDCDIDFLKDGLRLCVDGDRIFADGTTLGGDNGIAAAYALAILDATDLRHPPLEVIFTTDEEIGMLGAAAIDLSDLQGRVLLNMDSEEEGVLTVSCAGGAACTIAMPYQTAPAAGQLYRLEISGLTGGHSGVEIHKGRANANKLLGDTLRLLREAAPLRLVSAQGGTKDNAITRSACALFVAPAEHAGLYRSVAAAFAEEMRGKYAQAEPFLQISCTPESGAAGDVWNQESSDRAIRLLCDVPNGVQAMSRDMEGLVETSLNLGILKSADGVLELTFSVRSSVGRDKEALTAILRGIAASCGAAYSQRGDYPAWEYRKESPLRELMVEIYEEQYGEKPQVVAIHAGLECGLLASKLPGLDSVSFGPDLMEIHTTRESMSIASVARMWKYLLTILERL